MAGGELPGLDPGLDPSLDPSLAPSAILDRSWLQTVKHHLGLDRAIAFTVVARICSGIGSVGTVLIIVRILSPIQQGYYYTLWSLVALQAIFELGFSFVILQIAAHERVHLSFHADGSVTGSQVAYGRLASVLQRAVRWYSFAAIVMGVSFVIGGTRLFSLHQQVGTTEWRLPLYVTVLACSITFSIGPILSFLEGCGQVAAVARTRLFQSITATGLAWTSMLSHHGLFAPAAVLVGQGVVACVFLYSRRSLLGPLLLFQTSSHTIDWRREVWPFQWKIAVTWLCDYFIFQLFTPVIFAFRGPVEAGQMGLSMSAVMQLSGIILVWMSTKAAPFGNLVARRNTSQLDHLFFRTLRQSLALFIMGAFALFMGALFISYYLPTLSHRIVSWPVFLLLLLTALGNHVVQSEALYLRAHKCEPFLVQSIVIASLIAGSIFLLAKPWGTLGVALAFFIILGVLGVISATVIFQKKRREWAKA